MNLFIFLKNKLLLGNGAYLNYSLLWFSNVVNMLSRI